jgi:hypothetical protein
VSKRDREKLMLRGLVLVLGVVLVLNIAGVGNLSGQGSGAAGCGAEEPTEETANQIATDDIRGDQAVPRNLTGEQKALKSALTPELQYRLDEALNAENNEERQEAIRFYMRGAYDLPTSQQKASAIATLTNLLVPATLPENEAVEGAVVPGAEEVESILDKKFMKEISAGAGSPMPKAFLSRTTIEAKSCNWWSAALAFFNSGGKYGQFCGKGTPNHCTSNGKATTSGYEGNTVCDDGGNDNACAKHDDGRHTWDVWGFATISQCEVDRAFKAERNAAGGGSFHDGVGTASEFLNGANCLFGTLPCYRYESSTCWRWNSRWWGGYYSSYSCNDWSLKWPGGNYASGGCGSGGCYK